MGWLTLVANLYYIQDLEEETQRIMGFNLPKSNALEIPRNNDNHPGVRMCSFKFLINIHTYIVEFLIMPKWLLGSKGVPSVWSNKLGSFVFQMGICLLHNLKPTLYITIVHFHFRPLIIGLALSVGFTFNVGFQYVPFWEHQVFISNIQFHFVFKELIHDSQGLLDYKRPSYDAIIDHKKITPWIMGRFFILSWNCLIFLLESSISWSLFRRLH